MPASRRLLRHSLRGNIQMVLISWPWTRHSTRHDGAKVSLAQVQLSKAWCHEWAKIAHGESIYRARSALIAEKTLIARLDPGVFDNLCPLRGFCLHGGRKLSGRTAD